MVADWFDESLLDDEEALGRADAVLRPLAEAGARVRREAAEVGRGAVAGAWPSTRRRPPAGRHRRRSRLPAAARGARAVVPGALRGLAQPRPPRLGRRPRPRRRARAGRAGHRRAPAPSPRRSAAAARSSWPARRESLVAEHAAGRHSTVLPTGSRDQLATAVVMLQFLSRVDLGPDTDAEEVAHALDDVAVACSPYRDLAVNPAKMLAIALADATPLVWGGSVLAARAARRIAESMRRASGRTALAGDAEHLLPVIARGARARRLRGPVRRRTSRPTSARPWWCSTTAADEPVGARAARPAHRPRPTSASVRVETLSSAAAGDLACYASLLGQGRTPRRTSASGSAGTAADRRPARRLDAVTPTR